MISSFSSRLQRSLWPFHITKRPGACGMAALVAIAVASPVCSQTAPVPANTPAANEVAPTPTADVVAVTPIATPTPPVALPSLTAVANGEVTLTLEESVLVALRNHGDVAAAQQGFIGAREGITSARSNYFPQVTGGVNYNYNNTSRTGSGGSGFNSNGSSTTTDINVSQNIFDSGRTRAQVRQAQARSLNAVGGVGNTRNSLAYEVARNFYEQLRQERLVAQRGGQVELARRQAEQVQAQIEAGTAARVDIQSIQVNLSQAQFDLATARTALDTARVNFRNSLGLGNGPAIPLEESPLAAEQAPVVTTASAAPSPTPDLPEIPPSAAPTPTPFPLATPAPLPVVPQLRSLDEYLAEAQRLRPDLVQARANIQQSEASVSLARISARPQVTASAGYNIDPRSTGDRGFTFSAGLSIPIFDAGGRRAEVRAAQAGLEGDRIRLDQLTKDIQADVQAAYLDISGEVERIRNARTLVESARTNLATATERYQLGLGIVLDVVNAQTQLFNAQTSATQAVYDYELARANLERAIGRYAWADPRQAPPPQAPKTVPVAIAASASRPQR